MICVSLALAGWTVAVCEAATLLVPANYSTIQAAINAASNGDEVIVAPGTYTGPGNTGISLSKKITVRSATGAANCTIECASQSNGFTVNPGALTEAVLDGFTIRHGIGGGSSGGGGISISSRHPRSVTA